MEPANKPPVRQKSKSKVKGDGDLTDIEFLPDADEVERSPLPRVARITLHVLLAALLSFLLWATFSEVDQVVVAHGRLVTPLPNIVVQPLETSIIHSIDVRVGQVVKKGDRLATLDPTFTEADQAQLRAKLQSLDTQSQRLAAEMAGKFDSGKPDANADSQLQAQLSAERQANYRAQQSKMDASIARLRASIETNRRDQRSLAERLQPVQELEAMQEKLAAQHIGSKVRLLEIQSKRLDVERDMQLAANREQELKRELASAEAEKVAFEKGWRQKTMEDLLATSRDLDDVREQLQKADMRNNLVTLTSPSDAVVLEIAKFSQGSVVTGGQSIFTLVPLNAELEAEVQIDSLDVGYVKVGDRVRLKFDAFPFQRHGVLDANVRTISEDAFRREPGGQGMDAYYISRIDFGNATLKNMPGRSRLLPGMTLSAEIVVGKRSVISFLLWPLTKALDESIREP